MARGRVLACCSSKTTTRSASRCRWRSRTRATRSREAPDGADGLAAFDQREADLVLLDLRLPDMSGFDVCRALRARSIVPIIIITAQTDTYDLVAGLEAGADDYITKPVVPKELAARIRALLRRVQLQESSAAPRATRFGDVELRREQGRRAQGRARAQPDEDRVPPAVRVRRPRRIACSPGTSCWSGCGGTSTSATLGSSTPTCGACG